MSKMDKKMGIDKPKYDLKKNSPAKVKRVVKSLII